jgi:hypothetical protein
MSDTGTWPLVAPRGNARPDLIPAAPQRFGDTHGTMSDTWTGFDET